MLFHPTSSYRKRIRIRTTGDLKRNAPPILRAHQLAGVLNGLRSVSPSSRGSSSESKLKIAFETNVNELIPYSLVCVASDPRAACTLFQDLGRGPQSSNFNSLVTRLTSVQVCVVKCTHDDVLRCYDNVSDVQETRQMNGGISLLRRVNSTTAVANHVCLRGTNLPMEDFVDKFEKQATTKPHLKTLFPHLCASERVVVKKRCQFSVADASRGKP